MPTPRFDDLADVALSTDEALLERVRDLVQGAYRRQLWLMFLDDSDCQLPLVMPHDVDDRPSPRYREFLRPFLATLVDEVRPGCIVIVLERPGPVALSAGDRAWFALVNDACRGAGVPYRGPILVHDGGSRWIAAEDYLEDRE